MREAQPQPQPPFHSHTDPRLQPFNRVSTRIILYVVLSTFLTALVVSWISIQSTYTYLREQIDRSFPPRLEEYANAFEGMLDAGLAEASSLASGPPVATTIQRMLNGPPHPRTLALVKHQLVQAIEGSEYFVGFSILRPNGQVILEVGESATRADPLQPRRGFGSFHTAEGRPIPVALVPLPSGASKPAASLAATFRPDKIEQALATESLATPARAFVINGAGRAVAGTAPLAQPISLLDQPSGLVLEYTNGDNEHVLGSVFPLEILDWQLVIEAPFEKAFAPVLSVVTRIFAIDLFIIVLFGLLAYKVTTRMTKPIVALSDAALRISQGQLDLEIEAPETGDEISLLTRTFNDMMRKLRRNQVEIERVHKQLTTQNYELHRANEVLAQLSITDGLTKLHNHRYFQDHLTREIKRVGRTREPLSMLLLDLDDFKRLNDRLGHAAGDELLVRVAQMIDQSVRESDLLARYGGEEFVVLAAGTDLRGAVRLAEKIRMSVADNPHIVDDSLRPVSASISIGVAKYQGDRKRFFQEADRALYRAKAEGKNCVVAAEEVESSA